MLILTRRVGETLMVGDEVSVTVLGVKAIKFALALMHQKILQCIVKRFINAFSTNELCSLKCNT
ncbi:Carbon storage regulator [Psychrobacter phenylpyruvicus]|uniref:Carbon storage regulator n=1 Tax=Psychrobacter phenylpyruvicus TaxID=29432 RepID=A0A379LRY9_9GAMM|nr:Carbon storage regulator [Psychrobacter phenylpyruvicus]